MEKKYTRSEWNALSQREKELYWEETSQKERLDAWKRAEFLYHSTEMKEGKTICLHRGMKRKYGYDAAFLWWHIMKRQEMKWHQYGTNLEYFVPLSPYHEMLDMTEDEFTKALSTLVKEQHVKTKEIDGETGYSVTEKDWLKSEPKFVKEKQLQLLN